MRDIAKEADIKVSAIYHHFPSKVELLLAVETEAFSLMTSRVVENVSKQTDPWARLEAACEAHMIGVLKNRDYIDVTTRELPRDHSARVRQKIRRLRDNYENIFRDLIADLPMDPSVNRTMFRLTLLGAMAWALVWYRPERSSPESVAKEMIKVVRYGAQ